MRGGGGEGGDLASRPLLSSPSTSSAFKPTRGAVQMGIVLSKVRMQLLTLTAYAQRSKKRVAHTTVQMANACDVSISTGWLACG